MKSQINQNRGASLKRTGAAAPGSTASCPRCGGKMISDTHQVSAQFPAPALERAVCSEPECNYVRYVKLDEDCLGENYPVNREEAQ